MSTAVTEPLLFLPPDFKESDIDLMLGLAPVAPVAPDRLQRVKVLRPDDTQRDQRPERV